MSNTQRPKPEGQESSPRSCTLSIIKLTVVAALLVAALLPNFTRHRCSGCLTACKSNMKNLGTAMEMYASDWNGSYPPRGMEQLTPNYLKTIPDCLGTTTYVMVTGPSAPYNTQSYSDYYFVYCDSAAHEHVETPAGYPQYNGMVGVIER